MHSNSWKVIQSQNQYFLINQKLGWSVGELVVLNINAIYLLFELPYICICTSSCGITLGSSELPFWLSGSGSAGLSGKLNKKGTQHILIRNLNQSTKHLGYHTWGQEIEPDNTGYTVILNCQSYSTNDSTGSSKIRNNTEHFLTSN